MSDNKVATIHLGDVIYADIDSNEYLREIHDNLLYNYAAKMLNIFDQTSRPVDKIDALRFADLLSKSTHSTNSDQHKMWAQEIITLLCSIYPDDPAVSYYAGSVLTSTGNYQGRNLVAKDYQSGAVLDRMYSEYSKELLTIPAMPEFQFLRAQKQVYDHLTDQYFSYSGPTSMGKSFIMRMFLKSQVESGVEKNFALIVPTKALINEVTSKIINDLKENLKKYNYRLVTSAGALVLKEQHNFIFVLTPERLLYLLISNPDLELHYLFVDEAHKLSEVDSRGPFYYKVIDKLVERKNKPHVIFASPNIPNPEIYLRSIPDIETPEKWKLASSFSPVTQFKFLISFRQRSISMFNDYSRTLTKIAQFTGEISLDTILPLVSRDSDVFSVK
ncbi:DEAD/DEAH box helicase [Intestinimonas sp. HCP28S3_D6]|uniref:DEAD/DEAH box helicase n=1 Tax=Intestinimonas sp. HCP28S3_D6 TaxID=3438942 RepID=UPI003F898D6F